MSNKAKLELGPKINELSLDNPCSPKLGSFTPLLLVGIQHFPARLDLHYIKPYTTYRQQNKEIARKGNKATKRNKATTENKVMTTI